MVKFYHYVLILAALVCSLNSEVAAYGDTAKSARTIFPASYFKQKNLQGASTAKVLAIDKGVNSITFTNPYATSSTETVWAGTISGTIDGQNAKFFCIDISHYLIFWTSSQPNTYTDNGTTPSAITYILNNYYPYKAYPYTGSASSVENEAASVQCAIWHYSDGVDASTINNSTIKTRALQIIADVDLNSSGTSILSTFTLTPSIQSISQSTAASVVATALNSLGAGVSGLTVNFSTTAGTLSATSGTTTAAGQTPAVTLSANGATQATITAVTSYSIPQGTKYENTITPNGYQKLVLATPTVANRQAQSTVTWNVTPSSNCDLTSFTTFTQGGYGSPSNSTPGGIRDNNFSDVFPNGLTIGSTYTAKFTSAAAIKNFLPAGGAAKALTQNYTDAASTGAGVFGGQVVALALSVYFDSAGVFGNHYPKLADLVVASGTAAGKTVGQILSYCNAVIGGGTSPFSISDLNTIATGINENFDNGTANTNFLSCPVASNPSCNSSSQITSNFNSTAISTGKYIWFNSHFKLSGAGSSAVTIYFTNGLAKFTVGTTAYSLTLPNAQITFSPSVSTAVTTFNATTNTWVTQVPLSTSKDVFLTGLSYPVPAVGLPGGITPITLQGDFQTSTTGVGIDWQWGASVYTQFASDYNSCGVQNIESTDHCGTPANQKPYVTAGARCKGGTDYTGSWCSSAHVVPCVYVPQVGSIGDYVWNDANQNGTQDVGETGVPGVTVQLYSCANALLATTVTDATGKYLFGNLAAGIYYVKVTLPSGYVFSTKNVGDVTKDSDFDPTTGQTVCTNLNTGENNFTLDAGIHTANASIGDLVWIDVNENGLQDAGELGCAGVTVKLYNCGDTLKATTVTNANGTYLFSNLITGSYYVQFTLPSGYAFSGKNLGTNSAIDSDVDPVTGKTTCFTVNPGVNDLTRDAGIHIIKGSIGDLVWKDLNQNGIQDAGEPGLANVTVRLYDCSNNFIASTITDNSGLYKFSNVTPSSYYVQFLLPAGYVFSPMNAGSDSTKNSDAAAANGKTNCFTIAPNQNDISRDAGMYLPKASVGDKVWNDLNHDGSQDNPISELGIPNVVVKLYTCGGSLVFTTVTDQAGNYLFSNLDPGDYYIQYMLPSGFAFSRQNNYPDTTLDSDPNVTTGKTACFTLTPGMNDLTRDAAMYEVKASIGDYVWNDLNQDGIQDNNEVGIPNVTVRLFDCSENIIATTITNAAGLYNFSNVTPGLYHLQFYAPTGFAFSPKKQGANSFADSDADPSTGKTTCDTVKGAQIILDWDAGMYELANNNADLHLTKTSSISNAQNNDLVTYTIKVTNDGPHAATGVTVSDKLPSGLIFVSASPSGVYDTATGVWNVGTIANGSNATLQITAKVSVSGLNNAVVDLGPAKDYNMFVLEDMEVPSSDTQGKLAVGRDANLDGYSVGDQLPNSNGTVDMLIVGRDLIFKNGRVFNGNVVYGNNTNLPKYSVSIEEGTLRKANVIDFASASSYLNNLSTQLSKQPTNGATSFDSISVGSEVFLTGTDPFVNVFSVDGTKLANAVATTITVPNGSVVLINISGKIIKWGYGLIVNGTAYSNALFNFYEADSLILHDMNVTGSILAPKTSVNFIAGYQSGQMICRTYHGKGQMNIAPFIGNLPASKDVVNIAEVRTSAQHDPDSTPGNGNSAEDDYGSTTLHVSNVNASNPNWNLVSSVPGKDVILSMTNNDLGSVYSGTSSGNVYTSTNGSAWTSISPADNVGGISSVVATTSTLGSLKTTAANSARRLVIGTGKGVYISDNDGAKWDTTSLKAKDVRSIVSGADGSLYAGTWLGGVFKSADKGKTWNSISTLLIDTLNINSLYLDNNAQLFATAFGAGIYKYSTILNSWAPVHIDYKYVWTIKAASNGHLYASTYGDGVYHSSDGGESWSRMNDGLTNAYIYSIAEDKDNNLVAISWNGGVYSLPHSGNTWTPIGLDGIGVSTVLINSVSNNILVATQDGSVFSKTGTLGVKENGLLPNEYSLSQNYPNPFNPSAKINFSIPVAGKVSLTVYNVLGQEVQKLVDNDLMPGKYTVSFIGKNFASGVYIYRLTTKNVSITKKMMMVK